MEAPGNELVERGEWVAEDEDHDPTMVVWVSEAERALDRWLPALSDSTRRGYSTDVGAWFAWCQERGIDRMHPRGRDIGEYLHSLRRRMKPSSRARRASAISSFYRWARDEGQIETRPEPPASARKMPRGIDAQRLHGLTAMQAGALTTAARADGPRAHALVVLLLTTGLRVQEALDVRMRDLRTRDGVTRATVVGKGQVTRTVEIPPAAVAVCRAYAGDRAPGEWLFLGTRGGQWRQQDVRRLMRRLGEQIGIPELHPHLLRHTAASQALDAGLSLVAVKNFLGHAQMSTTERYVQAASTIRESPASVLEALVTPP